MESANKTEAQAKYRVGGLLKKYEDCIKTFFKLKAILQHSTPFWNNAKKYKFTADILQVK